MEFRRPTLLRPAKALNQALSRKPRNARPAPRPSRLAGRSFGRTALAQALGVGAGADRNGQAADLWGDVRLEVQGVAGEVALAGDRDRRTVARRAGALQPDLARADLLGGIGAGVDVVDLAFHELGDIGGLDAASLGLLGGEGRSDLADGIPIAGADCALALGGTGGGRAPGERNRAAQGGD